MAEFMDDRVQHILGELRQALGIGPPHAQNAKQFFASGRIPDMWFVAIDAIVQAQGYGKRRLWTLAGIGVDPLEVLVFVQLSIQPFLGNLIKWAMLLEDL